MVRRIGKIVCLYVFPERDSDFENIAISEFVIRERTHSCGAAVLAVVAFIPTQYFFPHMLRPHARKNNTYLPLNWRGTGLMYGPFQRVTFNGLMSR